jgi:hypothetical protein
MMQQPKITPVTGPGNAGAGGDGQQRQVSLTLQLGATLTVLLSVAWQVMEAPGVATASRFLHRTGHQTGQTWLPTLGSWTMVFLASTMAAFLTYRRMPLLVGLTATVAGAAVLAVIQPVASSMAPAIAVAVGTTLALCLPRLAPPWQAIRWVLVLLCWPVTRFMDLGLEPGHGRVLLALALVGLAGWLPALAEQLTRRRSAVASGA